jgi:hypothetical protein
MWRLAPLLIGQTLAFDAPKAAHGRLIRLVDATPVPQAGTLARENKLWRIHSAFDLPSERFGFFELTDEKAGERFDRTPAVKGEIRIGDRGYLQAGRMAGVLAAGADILGRAGWNNARRLDDDGRPLDLLGKLREGARRIDRPIQTGHKSGSPLQLRLVAVKKPAQAFEAAKRKARRDARKGGHRIVKGTLAAAVILVTSLKTEEFSGAAILALYRLGWRIELGFKRLKSLIGLKGPPGRDELSARPYVLAHLLMILLLEPLIDAFEDSPRWAAAA